MREVEETASVPAVWRSDAPRASVRQRAKNKPPREKAPRSAQTNVEISYAYGAGQVTSVQGCTTYHSCGTTPSIWAEHRGYFLFQFHFYSAGKTL
jgi:hypothetical protein